jgi:hypothetical protein
LIPALFIYGKVAIKLANLYIGGLLFLDHRPVLGEKPPIGGKTEKPPHRWGRTICKYRAKKSSGETFTIYFFLFFFLRLPITNVE